MRPEEGHGEVAQAEIHRNDGHVAVFVRLGRDEIQHGRRALHAEETAHQAAKRAGDDLRARRGLDVDLPAEEDEVEADDDQDDAQHQRERMRLHPCEHVDGPGGNNGEGPQDQPQVLPIDQIPHPDADDERRGEGQQARQGRRLAVRRHQEGEYRHDEDPEAEARRPFDKTGSDRQQRYEQVLGHLAFLRI